MGAFSSQQKTVGSGGAHYKLIIFALVLLQARSATGVVDWSAEVSWHVVKIELLFVKMTWCRILHFFHEKEVYSCQQPNVRVVEDLSFYRINRIFSPSHIITVRSSLFLEMITNVHVFASSVNLFFFYEKNNLQRKSLIWSLMLLFCLNLWKHSV